MLKRFIYFSIVLAVLITPFTLTSCGDDDGDSKESKSTVVQDIDYENVKDFEDALNEGKDLEGKTVKITVDEYKPDGKLGYTIWSGEHLNFISDDNPKVEVGDTITVKVKTVKNLLGSWIITYKRID